MDLTRYYSDRLVPSRLSKPPILKSLWHMDWIHGRKCVATGSSSVDAHHVLRRSQGTNDYTCIPLNHQVHMALHSEGSKAEGQYGFDEKEALIATLAERVWELETALRNKGWS